MVYWQLSRIRGHLLNANDTLHNLQLSGILFIFIQHLATRIRPTIFQRLRNTDANQLTTHGLSLSSLLYWNYVLRSKHRGRLYHFLCAVDYVMIATTTTVSSFPYSLHSISHFGGTVGVFILDNLRHYLQYGSMASYKNHQLTCFLSTGLALYRTWHVQAWSPFLLRMYSSGVCSIIFYNSFSHIQTMQQFRNMAWYLPWLWHLHATICQQTSLEIAHHHNQKKKVDDFFSPPTQTAKPNRNPLTKIFLTHTHSDKPFSK